MPKCLKCLSSGSLRKDHKNKFKMYILFEIYIENTLINPCSVQACLKFNNEVTKRSRMTVV